jgi:hypothetical protein
MKKFCINYESNNLNGLEVPDYFSATEGNQSTDDAGVDAI